MCYNEAMNWFCPSLLLDEISRTKVNAWVKAQAWPEGTKPKNSKRYHTTLLYSEDDYGTEKAANLLRVANQNSWRRWNQSGLVAKVSEFAGSGGNRPIVLELRSPLFRTERGKLTQQADNVEVKYSRLYENWIPHVTIATIPEGVELPELILPDEPWWISFEPEVIDLHAFYESLK